MKLRIVHLIISFITFCNLASGQTASVKEGCVPLEVSFQGPAGVSGYFWDFKDGVTSNRRNPANIFNKPGVYNVTLQENPTGPVLGTVTIKVYAAPVVKISGSSGCVPLPVSFQNNSEIDTSIIPLRSYTWIFGDGEIYTGKTTPVHTYKTPGVFQVSVRMETAIPSCNRTASFPGAVEAIAPPAASYTTNPERTSSCNDSLAVLFRNTSTGSKPLIYSWDFGNGDTSTKQHPPEILFRTGQFNPRLTAAYAQYPSCSTAFSKPVLVNSAAQAAILTRSDTVCVKTPFVLKTNVPGITRWTSVPQVQFSGTNADSTTVLLSKTGTYRVQVTITSPDGFCTSAAFKDIVADSLTAEIISSNSFGCEDLMKVTYKSVSNRKRLSYLWTLVNKSDSLPEITHTYESKHLKARTGMNNELYLPVTLFITDSVSGCTAEAERTDTLWRPRAILDMSKGSGCIPLPVTFTDVSTSAANNKITRRIWKFGTAKDTVFNTAATFQQNFDQPGTYDVRLVIETQEGCNDTTEVTVKTGIKLSDRIDFTTDKRSVCLGEPFALTAILPVTPIVDNHNFVTFAKRNFNCREDHKTWMFNDTSGFQDITLNVDQNGCRSSLTKKKYINVKGAVGKADYNFVCDEPLKYNFQSRSGGATNVKWDFGDGNSSTGDKVSHVYTKTGNYLVTLQAFNDTSVCPTDFDTVTVQVRELKARITFDSILCHNVPRRISAATSIDVNTGCYTGYNWFFSSPAMPPLTTTTDTAMFTFPERGVQQVHLVVKDVNGCRDTAHATVKIFDMDLKAKADKMLICPPNDIQFADSSSGDTTLVKWEWNFDDATAISEEKAPLHTFSKPGADGVFNVKLKVTDALACSETLQININQYRPVSRISVSDSTVCQRDSVTLQASDYTLAGSRLSFRWNLLNGAESTTQRNRIRYDTGGVYRISLYYNELSSGCNDSAFVNIRVHDYPKAAMFSSADTLGTLCAPQSVFFRDESVSKNRLNQFWNFGNGTTSNAVQHSLSFPKGSFTVKHFVSTDFGCRDSVQRVYRVLSPEGNFVIQPAAAICKGDSITFTLKDTVDVVSYAWAFGDGTVVENVSPVSHAYTFHPPSGQTEARLLLRGREGCQYSPPQKPIRVHQVIAAFQRETGNDTSICFSEGAYHFTNVSRQSDKIQWDFGDGTFSQENNPVHFYKQPGVYKVKLSILDEQTTCKDTLTSTAIVFANPVLVARGDTACPGAGLRPVILNPDPASNYNWYTENHAFASEGPDPVLLGKSIQNYTVIQTDSNHCSDTAVVRTQVLEPLEVHNFDTTIVMGDTARLPVLKTDLYNFKWSPEQWLSCTNCAYPLANPVSDTRYTLTVNDIRGCSSPVYSFNIFVRQETFVALPQSFTPNGDGVNDVVKVNGWGIKELDEFLIFNRWGQMVFSTKNAEEGWDGKLNGVVQPTDIYVYKVKARDFKDKELYQEGFINLLQ